MKYMADANIILPQKDAVEDRYSKINYPIMGAFWKSIAAKPNKALIGIIQQYFLK
jgi:hypothetical protein